MSDQVVVGITLRQDLEAKIDVLLRDKHGNTFTVSDDLANAGKYVVGATFNL